MSAVVKEDHVESIFDYDLTDEEKFHLFGDVEDWQSAQEYYELHFDCPDSLNADLYQLFSFRGQSKKALYFLEKIQNADYKRCVTQPFCIH